MAELAKAAVERIIRKASGLRVSDKAALELAEILEEIALKISQEAALLARHAKRKTVTASDIRLAARKL
ncbi:MAG: NFYB/HAP3 family transcription factor subunit [Candidatus Diapherotrites archaeon]|nr:NFYB/HAP3 family transcription factor subunit [Candidatus Diapherotrites archaeon]